MVGWVGSGKNCWVAFQKNEPTSNSASLNGRRRTLEPDTWPDWCVDGVCRWNAMKTPSFVRYLSA